jgi:acyl carrier protein
MRFLREQIAARLLLDDGDVDGRAPLMSLGMSSLQIMELKMLLEQQLALPLPSSLVFDYPTLLDLVPRLLLLLGLEKAENTAPEEGVMAPQPTVRRQGHVLAELAAELAELRDRS